jgi:hypothetical protein
VDLPRGPGLDAPATTDGAPRGPAGFPCPPGARRPDEPTAPSIRLPLARLAAQLSDTDPPLCFVCREPVPPGQHCYVADLGIVVHYDGLLQRSPCARLLDAESRDTTRSRRAAADALAWTPCTGSPSAGRPRPSMVSPL